MLRHIWKPQQAHTQLSGNNVALARHRRHLTLTHFHHEHHSLTPVLTYMFRRSLSHLGLFLEGHTYGSAVPYSFSKQLSLTFSKVQFCFLLPCPEILFCSEAKDLVLSELRYILND